MSLAPTPVTAALAGIFSGLTWPWLWPLFHGQTTSSTLGLVFATVVLIALPAHAFVLGFNRASAGGGVDAALLKRVGAWVAAAAIAAVVVAALRGSG
jgi:hypothetical protein